jgi:hypothetical protein
MYLNYFSECYDFSKPEVWITQLLTKFRILSDEILNLILIVRHFSIINNVIKIHIMHLRIVKKYRLSEGHKSEGYCRCECMRERKSALVLFCMNIYVQFSNSAFRYFYYYHLFFPYKETGFVMLFVFC